MDEIKIDLNNCCMEVVSEESASIFSGFTSGSPEIDRYFREVAASDPRNVCYAFYNQKMVMLLVWRRCVAQESI